MARRLRSAILQLAVCPRWLEYSGLPQALGATVWAVFRALVVLDHQTLGMKGRRRGKGRKGFTVPHEDVIAMTGLSLSSLQRALVRLQQTSLLARYRAGRGRLQGAGGRWSEFQINTDTLVALYRYVAPRLPPMHGGIQDVDRKELPAGGIQIYGREEFGAVHIPWEKLSAAQTSKAIEEEAEAIEIERVAEICEITWSQ